MQDGTWSSNVFDFYQWNDVNIIVSFSLSCFSFPTLSTRKVVKRGSGRYPRVPWTFFSKGWVAFRRVVESKFSFFFRPSELMWREKKIASYFQMYRLWEETKQMIHWSIVLSIERNGKWMARSNQRYDLGFSMKVSCSVAVVSLRFTSYCFTS